MTGPRVTHHLMNIEGRPGVHVVAKVERISSPPTRADSLDDPRPLARLVELLRCGEATRAYADFAAFKRESEQDPTLEWNAYREAVCQKTGLQGLEPLELSPLAAVKRGSAPAQEVTYHLATMNNRPYVVAAAGPVLGSPAAVMLVRDPERSALERLADVFRIGTSGLAFAELHQIVGPAEAGAEWDKLEQSVARARREPKRALDRNRLEAFVNQSIQAICALRGPE